MSNEQMRERERRSPLDGLQSVGMAALAGIAGAAILYRNGGADLLTEGMQRAGRALSDMGEGLSSRALKDVDADAIRSIYNTGKSSWASSTDSFKGTIKLDQDSPWSLAHVVKRELELRNNPRAYLGQAYDSQRIFQPLQTKFINNYSGGDGFLAKKLNNFVEDAVKNKDEAFFNNSDGLPAINGQFMKKHFEGTNIGLVHQQEMMADIMGKLMEKEENFNAYLLDNTATVTAMANELADPENIARKIGKRGRGGFVNGLLGDTPITARELVEAIDSNRGLKLKGGTFNVNGLDQKEFIDILRERISTDDALGEGAKGWGDLYVDRSLRKDAEGNIRSFKDAMGFMNKALDEFSNTLPGKLTKTRDMWQRSNAPIEQFFVSGKSAPILASLEEGGNNRLQNSYSHILGRTYKIAEDGSLEHVAEADNLFLGSGKHGTQARLTKQMAGDGDAKRPVGGQLWRNLDLNSSAVPSKGKEWKSFAGKFDKDEWARNILNGLMNPGGDVMPTLDADDNYVEDSYDRIKTFNKFLKDTSHALDKGSARKLSTASSSASAKHMFDLLQLDDDDLIEQAMKMRQDTLHNNSLVAMLQNYGKDSARTTGAVNIKSDNAALFAATSSAKFGESLRKEIAKEGFLDHARGTSGGLASLKGLFDASGLQGEKFREAKYLAYGAVFESDDFTGLAGAGKAVKNTDVKRAAVQHAYGMFSSTSNGMDRQQSFFSDFRNSMAKMVREKAPMTQKGFQRMDEDMLLTGSPYGDWTLYRKSVSPLDVLKNLNDATTRKSFVKQFGAGRRNMQDVTTATMFPYFAVSRLIDPLNPIGLGFSAKNTGSTADLVKAIGLLRVAPIVGGITALSYLNDTSRSLTGTSLYGAAANGLAGMDIGRRQIGDRLGLTRMMKDHRALNPMSQYAHSEEEEYRSAEEQREWYANGVAPVRKGRWWSFGSFSEYRGGKIDYYQPNYLRRAQSNYYDVSVYGSSEEKWAHSWVPTPQHPFAPIRRLLDPYWLERKHYFDRPYPVTGKMFEEGTPWGAVLNPTVGAILKPQRRMHRAELGSTMTDVRDLIADRNKRIMDKATGNQDLLQIGGLEGGVTPVNYTPMGNPAGSDIVATGRASRYGGMSLDAPGINYANEVPWAHEYAPAGTMRFGQSLTSRIQTGAAAGGVVSGIASSFLPSPTEALYRMNAATRARAGLPQEGVITADSIFKTKAKHIGSFLHNEEAMADLRNVGSVQDSLRDIGYSAKELSGMYGFLLDEAVSPRRTKRLAQAGKMTSYSRTFWDASVGGRGGEFMEIARRFFPHEDHTINQINPIRNTMPEWMPGRYQHGDPYASLPKGEMRLPGAGYETLNNLHPDEFGAYGAYDRMKILADIAPSSREYKVWRDIASKTVRDPGLRNEMKAVRKNVMRQSQNHDFYSYKFLGQSLETSGAIIDEVDAKGFTIVGSDKRHAFAGINIGGDVDIKDYLQSGMNIGIKTDANKYHRLNSSGNISSIVLVNGQNLNKKLLDAGLATHKDSESQSAADAQARFTSGQVERGKVYEAIAHAQIPFIHDKFMRVNTPLESYKQEQVYGSSYSTWSHPIKGFVQPMLQRAWAGGPLLQLGTAGLWALGRHADAAHWNGGVRKAVQVARGMTNPASFIGATVGYAAKMQGGSLMKMGLNMGAAASVAGYAVTKLDRPIDSAINFAVVGGLLAKQLNLPKVGIDIGTGRGALIGAAVGVGLSALKNPDFNWDRMTGPWIPKNRKEQWEVEEYYDRLKYIKYMGLYEKASRKALSSEGVDIRRLINRSEFEEKKKEKAKAKLLASREKVRNSYAEGDTRAQALLTEIDEKLNALATPTMILRAGEYTKSAIAYRQAAESTIYGMKEDTSIAELLRAVPKNDRDYILEFSKERDPKKQDEILKYLAPYKRRALEIAWGRKTGELESNEKFFATHQLPGMFWAGWQPDVDLDNVQIKTIQNEGMMLSDFGFYDSQANTAEAKSAPAIDIYQETGGLELRKNLMTTLSGAGLMGVNVSVQPSSQPGIQMIANIARINNYKVHESLNNTFGRIFF